MKYAFFILLASFVVGIGLFLVNFSPHGELKYTTQKMPDFPVYIASKNGEVFGLPWCGSIPRIKPENTLIFSHKNDAEKSGFRPIKNCRGL